nr:hypothetical protein [Tanacetum cinerariifolium]GEZ92597.1 hypothetical protein [Tanacetum cinerariifolium]
MYSSESSKDWSHYMGGLKCSLSLSLESSYNVIATGVGNSCVGAAASCWGAGKAAAKQVEEPEQQVKEL